MKQTVFEPRNTQEARACSSAQVWITAEAKELQQMEDMKVLERVETLPDGKAALGARFTYRIKFGPDNKPKQYKARLVALGYQQRQGFDYTETFAPTGRAMSLRAMLALWAGRGLSRRQIDIKAAFLNADLEGEELYLILPPECGGGLYRVKKALYGLKQAPMLWYQKLKEALGQLGFRPSWADPGLFIRASADSGEALIVHVDDMLIFGSAAMVDKFVEQMQRQFAITISDGADFFIGMEIEQQGEELMLSQRRYRLYWTGSTCPSARPCRHQQRLGQRCAGMTGRSSTGQARSCTWRSLAACCTSHPTPGPTSRTLWGF